MPKENRVRPKLSVVGGSRGQRFTSGGWLSMQITGLAGHIVNLRTVGLVAKTRVRADPTPTRFIVAVSRLAGGVNDRMQGLRVIAVVVVVALAVKFMCFSLPPWLIFHAGFRADIAVSAFVLSAALT